MHRKNAISQSDQVLVVALGIILVTVSATVGSAMSYRPNTVFKTNLTVAQTLQSVQDVVRTQLLAEHRCLSEALYYEARGEGRAGEKAVAEVVFHRLNTHNHGHSICAVVYEGSNRRVCQFSFTCNGDLNRPREEAAWMDSERLAAQILTGEIPLRNITGGATHYHAVWVSPFWAPTLKKTTQIGNHIFYRSSGGHTRDS